MHISQITQLMKTLLYVLIRSALVYTKKHEQSVRKIEDSIGNEKVKVTFGL